MSEKTKDQSDIEYVSPTTDKVMCDGGNEELGHPAVYFKIYKKSLILFFFIYFTN
jgi:uncharacterized Zn-finger protein